MDVDALYLDGPSTGCTSDPALIQEVLDSLRGARIRSIFGMGSSDLTGSLYFVLKDRKHDYFVGFSYDDPEETMGRGFGAAVKKLRDAPCSDELMKRFEELGPKLVLK